MSSVSSKAVGFALLLFLSSALSSTGFAQSRMTLRGNVGASFFRAPETLSETLHSGVDFGLEAGVRVYEGLAVTVQGGYDQFSMNEETARLFQRVEAGDWSFLNGSVGLRYTYHNESDAHPYGAIGMGLYHVVNSNRKAFEGGEFVGTRDRQTATKMGAHLALGSLFRLDDSYAVFFEPRYIFYNVRENFSGTLRFFTLRLGLEVRL